MKFDSYRAQVEVTNEWEYYAGFNFQDHIKHELARHIGDNLIKTMEIEMGEDPKRQMKVFSTTAIVISKKEFRNVIMQAVNRAMTGMPPLDF